MHKDETELRKTINNELTYVPTWFKSNKLSLNIDKTNFISFKGKTHKPDDLTKTIDNTNTKQTN